MDTPDTGLEPIGQVTEYAVMLPWWPMYKERFHLRVIGRPSDGAPRLCIELTPETGIKDLEKDWAVIDRWRKELQAAFPVERLGDELREQLLAELSERQRHGESYKVLATWLTGQIEAALRVYLEWLTGIDPALADAWITDSDDKERLWGEHMASGRVPIDGFPVDLFHPRYGWVQAMELLRWFGRDRLRKEDVARDGALPAVDDAARAATLRATLDRLRNGESAFGDYPPITGQMVTDRLRQWRNRGG